MKQKIVLVVFVVGLIVLAWVFRDTHIAVSLFDFGKKETKSDAGERGEYARVARVIDGDTIILEDGRHIRYVGINAPEIAHKGANGQCYGEEAKRKNKELVEGKEVQLVRDVSEKDTYGRYLYFVFVGDMFVEEILTREGYARKMPIAPDISRKNDIAAWEKTARDGHLGLWGTCP